MGSRNNIALAFVCFFTVVGYGKKQSLSEG